MLKSNRRKTRFIPSSVQHSLLARAVLHWAILFAGTLTVLVCWQYLIREPHQSLSECISETWERFGPCFVVLLMVLPIVVHDCVKFSNRLAGPLLRLHGALENLAKDQPVAPIRFRSDDFCQELAEHFNTALLRFQRDADSHPDIRAAVHAGGACEASGEARS